jgi:hypothetical protein
MHRWSYIWEDTENRVISHTPYNKEYTQIYIKISSFKSLIYKLFLYFYRNSDTENNSSLFKIYAVDLRV